MTWLLTRGRVPFLCALVAATAWLGWLAAGVDVETTNASLESRDPASVAVYERFKATFGSDEDLLLAVAHPRLLDAEGIGFVAALTERISRIDGVQRVYSLANAEELVRGELGAEPRPILPPGLDGPELGRRVREALDRNPDLVGLFVSADRRTAGILIEIEDRPGDLHYRGAIIDALRGIAAEAGRDAASLHLTGIAVQKHDVSAMIARDTRVLMPLAVAVLGATLAVFFRRVLGVLLPLAVTGITLAWTLGVYRLAGLELNAITSLLPPVLMVLSLAVSVHLIQGWLDAPEANGGRVARVRGVVRDLLFPCFFCALTTAFGFASLATADIPAVQIFGVFAAMGVSISFAVGMTLVPVALSFLPPPSAAKRAPQHPLVRRSLAWAAETSAERPGRVLLVFGGITALALAGLPFVRNNTDLVRFLRDDAPLQRDTLFVDEHLTGANALDFVVARRDGAPLASLDAVRRLAAFERAILAREHVAGVSSVLSVLRQIERAESDAGGLALPADERAAAWAFDLLEAAPDRPLVRKLLAPDLSEARVNVRVRAVGTAVAAPLAEGILEEGRRIFGDAYALAATGAFYHVSRDSNRLVAEQVESFSLALGLVFLAIGALFRSARLTLIALVPNAMPVAWTGGLMGLFGIDLSTGTAMIASAVIGVVVDDTIHYLTGFSRAYRGDPREAVRRATAGTGAALFVNNVVLVLGFWVGCFGSFKPTIYFSLLSGVTMISALVCDLFVTPACLVLLDRGRRAPACA
jgi:predicted RND superfamily exporter protein